MKRCTFNSLTYTLKPGFVLSETGLDELVRFVVEKVNARLKQYFSDLRSEVMAEARLAEPIVDVAEDYTLRGGKRLRALLALIGYWSRNWRTGDLGRIIEVMAAIELLQSYLLIHDDVMDKDELRRGGPTAHVMFSRACLKAGWPDCEHYGISQAIVAGDYLEASAVALLVNTGLKERALSDLVSTYAKGLRRVAYGQYLDILFSKVSLRDVREQDVLLVYKLKTSSYTVELPLHLGAIASEDYNEELLRELTEYAIPAGIAFQIRDDVIGLFGDPSVTGKPAGSDVRSKKKTILIVKAYLEGNDQQKEFLELVYDRLSENDITSHHVEEVKRIVVNTGSLEYCEKLVDSLVKKSIEVLDNSKFLGDNAKTVLRDLTIRLAYREK